LQDQDETRRRGNEASQECGTIVWKERKLTRVTEASKINVLQYHFTHHKSHRIALSLNPSVRVKVPMTSRLIDVTAKKMLHFVLGGGGGGKFLENTGRGGTLLWWILLFKPKKAHQ